MSHIADLCQKIKQLKERKNALILTHYYQRPEVQDLADYVGDSLDLSIKASNTEADVIVYAGVRFMAEAIKLLNPSKKVIFSDMSAGDPLASSYDLVGFTKFVRARPDHTVVSYINSSLEIKALSDIVCTSSNAIKVIDSIPRNKPIIFAPDKNLGHYLIQQTGRDMALWDHTCDMRELFSHSKILEMERQYPEARLLAHLECSQEVQEDACYVGSSSGMINYVRYHPDQEFIVATEEGILHQMKKAAPHARLTLATTTSPSGEKQTVCKHIKRDTLQKLYHSLKHETTLLNIPYLLMMKARMPLRRMLELY